MAADVAVVARQRAVDAAQVAADALVEEARRGERLLGVAVAAARAEGAVVEVVRLVAADAVIAGSPSGTAAGVAGGARHAVVGAAELEGAGVVAGVDRLPGAGVVAGAASGAELSAVDLGLGVAAFARGRHLREDGRRVARLAAQLEMLSGEAEAAGRARVVVVEQRAPRR